MEPLSSARVVTAVCPNTPSAFHTLTSLSWTISTCSPQAGAGASWGTESQ